MKITKERLRQVIKEELEDALREGGEEKYTDSRYDLKRENDPINAEMLDLVDKAYRKAEDVSMLYQTQLNDRLRNGDFEIKTKDDIYNDELRGLLARHANDLLNLRKRIEKSSNLKRRGMPGSGDPVYQV